MSCVPPSSVAAYSAVVVTAGPSSVSTSSPPILEGAAADRAHQEELLSLAQERGWSLPAQKPYAWQLVAGISDVRPRVARILNRDVFELDSMCRASDDEEVASLATQLHSERRQLLNDLARETPSLNLPGAK